MENEIVKPVSLVITEFKAALTDLINNSNLPLFVIEPILKNIYNDVYNMTQKQLEIDSKKYKEALNDK